VLQGVDCCTPNETNISHRNCPKTTLNDSLAGITIVKTIGSAAQVSFAYKRATILTTGYLRGQRAVAILSGGQADRLTRSWVLSVQLDRIKVAENKEDY
jgi:hypothetical protein